MPQWASIVSGIGSGAVYCPVALQIDTRVFRQSARQNPNGLTHYEYHPYLPIIWSSALSLITSLMVKARIDDPLDTVAVHCGGGFWGLVFVPWVMYGGVVFGGNGYQDQNNGIGDAFLVKPFIDDF
jgi:hypothetical protein